MFCSKEKRERHNTSSEAYFVCFSQTFGQHWEQILYFKQDHVEDNYNSISSSILWRFYSTLQFINPIFVAWHIISLYPFRDKNKAKFDKMASKIFQLVRVYFIL